MKAAVRTVFALSVLACSHGIAETQGAVTPASVQLAAPIAAKDDSTGMKKDTLVDEKETARRKHAEAIQEMQEAQDKANLEIADSLRAQAKRSYLERKSRSTGGASPYPQQPPVGSP